MRSIPTRYPKSTLLSGPCYRRNVVPSEGDWVTGALQFWLEKCKLVAQKIDRLACHAPEEFGEQKKGLNLLG